jgi:hypothetical protein
LSLQPSTRRLNVIRNVPTSAAPLSINRSDDWGFQTLACLNQLFPLPVDGALCSCASVGTRTKAQAVREFEDVFANGISFSGCGVAWSQQKAEATKINRLLVCLVSTSQTLTRH